MNAAVPRVMTDETMNEPVYRVVANFGAAVAVLAADDSLHHAVPLSKLPQLVAGDMVVCEPVEDTEHAGLRVTALHDRTAVLVRPDRRHRSKPLAANLTHLAIVSAPKPGISTLLIDQFCIAAECAGIGAIIVVNKSDLLGEDALEEVQAMLAVYESLGYITVLVDTKTPGKLEPFLQAVAGRTVVLVGASGVGKSSIVKQVLPDLDVRVGAVSEATGLGAHTTTVTFWYELDDDAALIDSPGVRQFSVSHLTAEEVRSGYREIDDAASRCRFANCTHKVEPDCAVQDALATGDIEQWRFDNYLKLSSSIEMTLRD